MTIRGLGNTGRDLSAARHGWRQPGGLHLDLGAWRSVPEMENLHEIRDFVHAVVDQDRGMRQLAHASTPRNRTTDVGDAF